MNKLSDEQMTEEEEEDEGIVSEVIAWMSNEMKERTKEWNAARKEGRLCG
jgi:hypothetical protein